MRTGTAGGEKAGRFETFSGRKGGDEGSPREKSAEMGGGVGEKSAEMWGRVGEKGQREKGEDA